MGKPKSNKREIDKAKKERAALKRGRQQRSNGADAAAMPEASVQLREPSPPQAEVLARLTELHVRFEADTIDFEEYEQLKGELIAMLTTD